MSGKIVIWSARAATLALATLVFFSAARAQEPSPNAIAMAKELIELKGGAAMWDPVVPGLIERAKGMLIQSNPGLSKDLADVATQLRHEYAPRRVEVVNDMARVYAQHFTEQELKEVLAFYKTPLGRKIITEEPRVVDESLNRMNQAAGRIADEMLPRFRAEMKKKGHNL